MTNPRAPYDPEALCENCTHPAKNHPRDTSLTRYFCSDGRCTCSQFVARTREDHVDPR